MPHYLELSWRRRRELIVLGVLLAVTTFALYRRPLPRLVRDDLDVDLERLERAR